MKIECTKMEWARLHSWIIPEHNTQEIYENGKAICHVSSQETDEYLLNVEITFQEEK